MDKVNQIVAQNITTSSTKTVVLPLGMRKFFGLLLVLSFFSTLLLYNKEESKSVIVYDDANSSLHLQHITDGDGENYADGTTSFGRLLTWNRAKEVEAIEQIEEDREGRKKRFPRVIHIGERKTGTTALLHFLRQHPQVKAPMREVHYFDMDSNFIKGLRWYVDHMPLTTADEVTFEKSPNYFRSLRAPKRVHDTIPDVKLIISVRDPIKRAVSDFYFSRNAPWPSGFDKDKFETFEEFVFDTPNGTIDGEFPPIVRSQYNVPLKRWLQYFNRSQIYIFDGDDFLRENPVKTLKEIEAFMGVRPFFSAKMFFLSRQRHIWCIRDPGCISMGGQGHGELDNSVLEKLNDFYRFSNEEFFNLTGKFFRWGAGEDDVNSQ